MAERVVIAEITIDDKGVVTAVQRSKGEIAGLEKQTRATSDVFVNRMFSMRNAAIALTGTFTVGGAIVALKSWAEEAAKANAEFATLTAATGALRSELIRLANTRLPVTAALRETTDWSIRFSAVIDAMLPKIEQTEAATGGHGLIYRMLIGQTSIGSLIGSIETVGVLIDKLFKDRIEKIREGLKPPDPGILAEWEAALKLVEQQSVALSAGAGLGTIQPGFRVTQIGGIDTIVKTAERLPDIMNDVWEQSQPLKETWTEMTQPVIDIGLGWEATSDAIARINETDIGPQNLSEFAAFVNDIANSSGKATFGIQAMTTAIHFMAEALSTSLIEGGRSFKEVMAEMMRAIAQMAFVYSLWNLALGIMASTPWGFAFLGPPGPYFKAAAGFGAVGVAAAGAARAFGGGGGGNRQGSAAPGAPAAAASAGGGTRITFVNEGTFIGGDPNQFARWVNDLLRTQATDNA